MRYRTILRSRWARRDHLAILVVAVSIAFLTGAALLVVSVSSQSTALATEFDTTGSVTAYESVDAARAAAPPDAVVLPVAVVTGPGGTTTPVVGIPPPPGNVSLPPPPSTGLTVAEVDANTPHRLRGTRTTRSFTVSPRGARSIVPDDWYVGRPALVTELGTTGAFVVTPSPEAAGWIPPDGVPLQSVFAFLLRGTSGFLAGLWLVTLGSGILVGVTVFSVRRVNVLERLRTIRIVRATGAPRDTCFVCSGVVARC